MKCNTETFDSSMNLTPANQTQYRRRVRETAVDAGVAETGESAALAAIIKKNRATIRRNYAELDKLTRELEALDAQTTRLNQELEALRMHEAHAERFAVAA
jgi:hypothetical protein